MEFLPEDFELMNYYTSTHARSFQTFTVLVVKFLRGLAVVGGEGGKGRGREDDLWQEDVGRWCCQGEFGGQDDCY